MGAGFYEQALEDLKSSKKLREIKDFGNSAYFLQQCVEKYVKVIIYKYELDTKSRNLGHYPFIKILEETNDALKNSTEQVETCCIQDTVNEILTKMKTVFNYKTDEVFQKKLVAMWKESLCIPITDRVEKDTLTYLNGLKCDFKNVINQHKKLLDKKWPDMSNEYRKQHQDMFDSIDECIQLQENNMFELDDTHTDQTIEILFRIFKLFKRFKRFKTELRLHENICKIVLQLNQFLLILAFSDIIRKTYPHESIGRYPVEINGESSRCQYRDHSQNLNKLSNEVEAICKKLDNAIG